ncbi:hypothetical protein SMICM17S_13304 [Streptomyces microflavus]
MWERVPLAGGTPSLLTTSRSEVEHFTAAAIAESGYFFHGLRCLKCEVSSSYSAAFRWSVRRLPPFSGSPSRRIRSVQFADAAMASSSSSRVYGLFPMSPSVSGRAFARPRTE